MYKSPVDKSKRLAEHEKRKKKRSRASFFCVGYSNAWGKKAIHTRIGEIQKKYKSLSWIRTSMSYHRFPNMREVFSADLSRKLLENVKSLDFETLDCNCRRGICPYNKICRTSMVVYKAMCKTSKMSYISNTQNHLKKRMQQHFGQVNDVLKNGKSWILMRITFRKFGNIGDH